MSALPIDNASDPRPIPPIEQERLLNVRFSKPIMEELARLAALDDWHGLLAAFASYGIIAAAVGAGEFSAWLYPLAVFVIGSRQRALTTLLHDAAHGRVARSKWLNAFVGCFMSGYLIFQAFKPYRQSHVIKHHWYLGNAQHDPDFQLYLDAGLYKGLSPAAFFWRQVFSTVLLLNAPAYLWYVAKHRLLALVQSKGEFAAMAVFWACILAAVHALDGWRVFMLYWIVPYVSAFVVIGRFIEIAEHYPMLGAETTRTILHGTRNRMSHWLEALFFSMHHENYHLVHHLRPDIPFWNLRRAHLTLLSDPQYRRVNHGFGGIFLSRGRRRALIPALVSGRMGLPGAREHGLQGSTAAAGA